MMQAVAVILAVTLLVAGASNSRGDSKPVGVGAYAYQDSTGKRYEGTYDISEDDLNDFVPKFGDGFPGGFPPAGFPFADDFFPVFFKNLQAGLQDYAWHHYSSSRAVASFTNPRIWQRSSAFPGNHANQRAALKSVNTAFDSTFANGGGGGGAGGGDFYNLGQQYAAAGMNYGQPGDGANGGAGSFGNFQHPGGNSAYAAGSIGPQGTRQIASISPNNPNQPNIDTASRSGSGGNGGFYSVSSNSYSRSSDVGGKKTESRGAETVVNDNGNIKKYEVHS